MKLFVVFLGIVTVLFTATLFASLLAFRRIPHEERPKLGSLTGEFIQWSAAIALYVVAVLYLLPVRDGAIVVLLTSGLALLLGFVWFHLFVKKRLQIREPTEETPSDS